MFDTLALQVNGYTMRDFRGYVKYSSLVILGCFIISVFSSNIYYLRSTSITIDTYLFAPLASHMWKQGLDQNDYHAINFDVSSEKAHRLPKGRTLSLLHGVSAESKKNEKAKKLNSMHISDRHFSQKHKQNFFKVVETKGKASIEDARGNVLRLKFSKSASAKFVSNCLNANIPKTEEALMACKPKIIEDQKKINFFMDVIEAYQDSERKVTEESYHL